MPNSNLFTHCLLSFSREATSEIYGPRVYFPSYTFRSILPIAFSFICFFYFQIYIIKNPKIPCCTFTLFILFCFTMRSIYPIYYKTSLSFTREVLTTPLARRVASICSLCACTVYILLLGSPTGSITLVSSLREIPTVAVLHHPFLFGEKLTRTRAIKPPLCALDRA